MREQCCGSIFLTVLHVWWPSDRGWQPCTACTFPTVSQQAIPSFLLGILLPGFGFGYLERNAFDPVSFSGYALRSGISAGILCTSCLPLFPRDLYLTIKFDLIFKVFACFHHFNRWCPFHFCSSVVYFWKPLV